MSTFVVNKRNISTVWLSGLYLHGRYTYISFKYVCVHCNNWI